MTLLLCIILLKQCAAYIKYLATFDPPRILYSEQYIVDIYNLICQFGKSEHICVTDGDKESIGVYGVVITINISSHITQYEIYTKEENVQRIQNKYKEETGGRYETI